MPIVFQSPDPVAPNLSAAYGAAEMASRNNPVLQRGADSIASLYENQARMAQAQRMQEAELRNRSAAVTAQLQQRNEERAAEAADRALQLQAQRLHESQLQSGRLTFAQDEGNANRLQGIYDMQERAELQNWLDSQEMTQAEQMRLSRMENAVSEVMADPGLAPEEKENYVRQLRTGIDTGKQKMMQTQQRQMELENQRLEAQAMQELKVRALEAKTLPERTQTIYDQNMVGGIQPLVEAEFDRMFPNVALMPMGQQLRAAAIQKEVWERVAAAGGATQYIQDSPGKFVAVKHPKDEAPEKFDRKAHEEEAQNEADKAVPRQAGPTGKLEESVENTDYKLKVLRRMEEQWNREHAKPTRQPWAGTPFANRVQQTPSQRTSDSPAADEVRKVIEENKPFRIGEGTAEQNRAVKYLDDIRAGIRRLPGLNDQQRKSYEEQASTAIQLLSTYGSKLAMPPHQQEVYGVLLETLKRLAPSIPLREDQKQQPPRGFLQRNVTDPVRSASPFNRGVLQRLVQ